jgi:uncharacterized protein YdeI (BOF family)
MKRIIALVLFGLFFYQLATAQEVTPIEKLASGMTVTVQGEVTRILDEDEFRMKDSTGSVRVYIGWKNRMPVPVGETVLVRGVVDDDLEFRFRPEIYAFQVVREDGTVIDLNKREADEAEGRPSREARSETATELDNHEKTGMSAPSEGFTPIGELNRGMSAVIHGKVTSILDEDEFRMEDATGSVRVYIGWRNRMVVPIGEEITVRGVVDDDLVSFFRPEVYAFEITRQDGTIIKLD